MVITTTEEMIEEAVVEEVEAEEVEEQDIIINKRNRRKSLSLTWEELHYKEEYKLKMARDKTLDKV